MHNLEIFFKYKEAIQIIKQFLNANPNLAVKSIKCKDILQCLVGESITSISDKISPSNNEYTPDELDLLALFFTLIKILYLSSEIRAIQSLLPLIESIRGSNLHLTTIRNEHAYYCCIQQLVKLNKDIPPASHPPLYVIGDR